MLQHSTLLLLQLTLWAVCSDGGWLPDPAVRQSWPQHRLDLEEEHLMLDSALAVSTCSPISDCNITCTLAHLDAYEFKSTDYNCPQPETLVVTVGATSDEAVLRLRLDSSSELADGESLTVLEEGGVMLAMLTESEEAWVASQSPALTLEYLRSHESTTSQIQLSMVAYNQTQETDTIMEMTGELTAPEQANWTGKSPDYAVNTEWYWHLNLLQKANHVNFTVTDLDLDPAAGDVLIIGGGEGPYDTEPTAELLTGKFPRRRYHVAGGEAFVYFMSRAHAKPHTPFVVSYQAEPIFEPTTTVPTTTDRDHPPTPSGVDFTLPCFITGIDPKRFLDANDTAMEDLQKTLSGWADFYRDEHNIPTWRPVHSDDIVFSSWLMCDYASGWAKHDPNCVRVTWYIELLREDGDWAFLEPDLRGIVVEYGADINSDLGYKFSLTLDEVNETWWWAITIALVPLALLVFMGVLWMSSRATKVKSTYEEDVSIIDPDEINEDHKDKITNEVKTLTEKDQLSKAMHDDNYRDYDPELQGTTRHRGLHARLQPLKSALKKASPAPAAYVNAAYEGDDDGEKDGRGKAGGVRTTFAPEEPATVTTPLTPPAAAAPVAAPAVVAALAEPASSELTEQLRLLSEINKTLKEEERQAPGIELPRVDPQNKPPTAPEATKFRMNEDGTGTVVDGTGQGDSTLQLDLGSSIDDDEEKTSSV